jgi:hypothetical protein
MPRYVKIASQLPEQLHRRYFELDHGQKQLACAAGFLLYFECDQDTQWVYREWARAMAEGRADMNNPPESLRKLLPKTKRTGSTRKKR